MDVELSDRTVTAEVEVKNTGDVAGKDVVQLYTSVPYTDYDVENKVEKSAVQLLDYEKTDMIEPGESQTVTITADAQDMASWDSTCSNEAGTTGNWILDNGTYYFTVGNGAHEAVNNVLAAQDQDVEGEGHQPLDGRKGLERHDHSHGRHHHCDGPPNAQLLLRGGVGIDISNIQTLRGRRAQ